MDGLLPIIPVDATRHALLLGEVAALLPAMAASAPEHDQAATFPGASIAALRDVGVLHGVLPVREGGLGLGTEPRCPQTVRGCSPQARRSVPGPATSTTPS